MTIRVLILGGTTEARQLAERLSADKRFDVTVSLAGRTKNPVPHAAKVRIGGFGGAIGLTTYLAESGTDLVVDATHPFAAEISRNAQRASAASGTKLIAIRRPGWEPVKGDRWRRHADVQSAISVIGEKRQNVFVTLGRQELAPLLTAPQHRYVVRSVDPVEPPLDLPDADYVLARGPFDVDAETALMLHHSINVVITKNSGGAASYAKLEAARQLGISVEMIDRPEFAGDAAQTVDATLSMIDHWLDSEANLDV